MRGHTSDIISADFIVPTTGWHKWARLDVPFGTGSDGSGWTVWSRRAGLHGRWVVSEGGQHGCMTSAGDHCSTLGTRIGPLNSWNLDFKIGLMGHYWFWICGILILKQVWWDIPGCGWWHVLPDAGIGDHVLHSQGWKMALLTPGNPDFKTGLVAHSWLWLMTCSSWCCGCLEIMVLSHIICLSSLGSIRCFWISHSKAKLSAFTGCFCLGLGCFTTH